MNMNMCGFLILVIGRLAAAPLEGDLDKLRGTWLTVSLVHDGKTIVGENVPAKPGPATKLAYEGNTWKIKVADKTVATGPFRIDATKTPKEIDVLDESRTKIQLGIYRLDGDIYEYCLAPAGKPRPASFTSDAGSGHSLGVMRRENP